MIWVDITNLPHVLFFKNFIDKGMVVTSREFGMLKELLTRHGIDSIEVGRHAGKDTKKKLIESLKRQVELAGIISKMDVNVAVSKQSVEMPRVAFGLKIPSVQMIDNEFAQEQNRLCVPLCSRIVVPEALDKSLLIKQGADRGRIKTFDGIFELVNIRGFRPAKEVNVNLPGEPGKPGDYVLVRPEPGFASYFKGSSNTREIIDELKKSHDVFVIPRGQETYRGAKPLKNEDSLSLIYHARAFVGGGGTMNRESALLGTPTISFYPQDLLGVDRMLIKKGLMHHTTDPKTAAGLIADLSKHDLRKRADAVKRKMDDPLEIVKKEVDDLMGRPL